LKHLAVADIDFVAFLCPHGMGSAKYELYRAQTETDLKAWKRQLVEVLKDSPSKERKFLRWKVYGYDSQRCYGVFVYIQVVEEGELEVLPGTSL
jgi:hypothetical protein